MRTVLICHDDDRLNRDGLAAWLGSFSELAGILSIVEPRRRKLRRFRRELRRVGAWRFLDVLAFRVHHRLTAAKADAAWEQDRVARLLREHPAPDGVPVLRVESPNDPTARAWLTERSPDLVIARCKSLLAEAVFTIPALGTYVMHPGICPEYRNAHGCFWALAHDDLANVGMTLLRIDRGVDTGPVFGYFRVEPDPLHESALRLQHRTVFDNLPAIRDRLLAIGTGEARPLDTTGRASNAYGQPWLTRQLAILRRARRRSGDSS